jgi:hypothetical protein
LIEPALNIIAKNRLLEWVLGDDPTRAGTPQIQWTNLPESWGVFVLIGIVGAIAFGVFWLYRREINTCPLPLKMLLGVIRLTVLLLLIAMFLKPSVYYQQVSEIKPTIAMLRDSSMSLDRGDQYRSEDQARQLAEASGLNPDGISAGEITRAQLFNRIFKNDPNLLSQLRDKGAIKISDFADGLESVALIPAERNEDDDLSEADQETDDNQDEGESAQSSLIQQTMPQLVAEGLGTDIWQALKETLDDSSRISSIVLVSDGQHNGSEDPTELARKAESLGIPIFVVGVGDPNPPKNIAVTEVYVRDKAYPDEPFEIDAVLQTSQIGKTGMPPQIQVQLIQQKVDLQSGALGNPTPIDTRDIEVPEFGGRIRVDFDHILNQPGKYVFTVAVDPLEDETETADNQRVSSEIEVVDEKVKVLLVSGLPSWDYQQVQRLLQRDPSISLSCWLQSMDESRPQEGDEPISRLPRSMEELGRYNVVMLMDPNPEEFDDQWIGLLQEFCKYKAGGVLFMAGPQYTSEFITMNRLKGIRELLPVRFGDNEFIDAIQALASAKDNKPGQMLLVNHNIDHPVMSFRSDPAETQKIWSLMPGIYWSFPTMAAKPTARVLLERGDQVNAEGNQPLMVTGRYGAGTVLYLGFHGTWKWRPVGLQAQFFDRFWIQVVRYLVETRSLQGSRRGFIDAEKTEFELGERITLVGRVLDQEFRPSTEKEVTAIIRSADGRTQNVVMKLLPQQDGRYEGTFIAQRTGSFDATIKLSGGEVDEKLIDPISIRVVPPSAESGAFWLNEKLLTEIAEISGGKYYRLEKIKQLPDDLPQLITRAEFNSPPEPLWDLSQYIRWFVFFLPVALLSLEWAIRKWYKLL